MSFFTLTLWSQWHRGVVRTMAFEGDRIGAENALADFWNESVAVVSMTGRYRALLHQDGFRRAIAKIG